MRRSGFAWLCLIVAPLLFGASARADEREEIEALRQEVAKEREALAAERNELAEQRRRVDDALADLEREKSMRPAPGAAGMPAVSATPESGPGPYMDIYGFAMLDSIYDFKTVDPDWRSTLRTSKIPVNCPDDAGCGNDDNATISVKQSRFGVRSGYPTPLGELFARFEFDLFATGGNAGETNFRLRHAYGQLGPLLAGQTDSVFSDPAVFPNTIDYWGPTGMVFFRNPQLRYTPVRSENWVFAAAIESPGSALDEGKLTDIDPELDAESWNPSPDFTTHVRMLGDWGHVQAAAILRVLGFQNPDTATNRPDGTEIGWGFNLSSVIESFGDDQLLLQVVYGHGIASYMQDGGTDLAPDAPTDPNAEAVPTFGWLAYYNRTWNERWTSSLGFSEHRQETTRGQLDSAFEVGQYLSANLLYHPVPQMLIGPEFLWGRRENRNGDSEPDARVQFSVKYDFDGRVIGGGGQR